MSLQKKNSYLNPFVLYALQARDCFSAIHRTLAETSMKLAPRTESIKLASAGSYSVALGLAIFMYILELEANDDKQQKLHQNFLTFFFFASSFQIVSNFSSSTAIREH